MAFEGMMPRVLFPWGSLAGQLSVPTMHYPHSHTEYMRQSIKNTRQRIS